MSNAFDPFQGWDEEESAQANAGEKAKSDDWFSDTAWGTMDQNTSMNSASSEEQAAQEGAEGTTPVGEHQNDLNATMDSNAALAETSMLSFDNSSVNWSFLQPGENSSATLPTADEPSPAATPATLPATPPATAAPAAAVTAVAGGEGEEEGKSPFSSSTSNPDSRHQPTSTPKSSDKTNPSGELFPSDPMSLSRVESHGTTIHVAIQEQLSCLFDDFSNGTSRRIEGTIHVQAGDELVDNPFLVHIQDTSKHVSQLLEEPTICQDITAQVIESENPGDRVLRVNLTPKHTGETCIASYVCDSGLRPIPLLVKTKVRAFHDIQKVRVGIKIRSNPSNAVSMTRLAVIMAVPPDVNGETVLMSKEGGVWDSMKRLIAWSLEPLEPGHVIEVQCQLDFMVPSQDKNRPTPRFPVLIRCDAIDEQFSDIDISGIHDPTIQDKDDHHEQQQSSPTSASSPIQINVSRSTRILHRKV